MAYLTELLTRITNLLSFSNKSLQEGFDHVLCIYLKCDSRIFLEKVSYDFENNYYFPLMTSVSPVLDITSELRKIRRFISKLFKINIQNIDIYHKPFTLEPLYSRTFHVAVIEITSEQAEMLLREKNNRLVELPENHLYLNQDNNFLYNIYCNRK